ncbi:hypothetical protein SAMN05421813_1134 [Daejeonella rubra]|uniref:Uncharacterized protein n=1 Tax=Daejeonella rubra TaxID=990371 RepID=A0A1G9TGC8_9SPHI|nr:hypothetical protein SAMN05421813_1134 [Daejeonella rubra]
MKANHNQYDSKVNVVFVVVNISSSKNESKSQLCSCKGSLFTVVVNISSSKNESKSQLSLNLI